MQQTLPETENRIPGVFDTMSESDYKWTIRVLLSPNAIRYLYQVLETSSPEPCEMGIRSHLMGMFDIYP